jgi:hypothetical protein
VLGEVESSERFACIALHQSRRLDRARALTAGAAAAPLIGGAGGDGGGIGDGDPTLFAAAFKRSRFYCLSRREPAEPDDDAAAGRDVFNEKPTRDELALTAAAPKPSGSGGSACVISTSKGEIHLRLYAQECPRTIENFTTHASDGCAPCVALPMRLASSTPRVCGAVRLGALACARAPSMAGRAVRACAATPPSLPRFAWSFSCGLCALPRFACALPCGVCVRPLCRCAQLLQRHPFPLPSAYQLGTARAGASGRAARPCALRTRAPSTASTSATKHNAVPSAPSWRTPKMELR